MLHPRHAVPAKEEQADEGGFQKECHQPFDRQRGTEDVADIVRVVGPVGAELEFEREAGGDPHGEVDAEQLAPKLGHVAVNLTSGHHIDRFHDHQYPRKSQRERHEQEVIHGGRAELQA